MDIRQKCYHFNSLWEKLKDDRNRLIDKERDEEAPSIEFEIEGLQQDIAVPVNYILGERKIPHINSMIYMLQLLEKNDIIDHWKTTEGPEYPAIMDWLQEVEKIRLELIQHLSSLSVQPEEQVCS